MKTNVAFKVLISVIVIGCAGLAFSDTDQTKHEVNVKKARVWPGDKYIYIATSIAGISQAKLWGDPYAMEHYGFLAKIAASTKVQLHTHRNDIGYVVISGTYLYGDGINEQRLGPGSVIYIPAGFKHTHGAATECVVYEEAVGKTDTTMVK